MATPSEDIEPGERFGAYVVERLLGVGATSRVYLGRHRQLGRRAAIKVLTGDLLSEPKSVERLFREARLVNDIHHPNIVDIFDVVEVLEPERRVALIMEHVPGPSLKRLERRLSRTQALGVTWQVIDALEAAHRAGVIHRDLKPDNLLLMNAPTEDPHRVPVVKVIDFGIAKAAGSAMGVQPATSIMIGTPGYMAPEQIAGTPPPSEKTDVYALAEVLYELLTGERAFPAEWGVEAVVKAKLRGEKPKLDFPSDLPSDLTAWIEQSMAYRQERRPDLAVLRSLLQKAMPSEVTFESDSSFAESRSELLERHQVPKSEPTSTALSEDGAEEFETMSEDPGFATEPPTAMAGAPQADASISGLATEFGELDDHLEERPTAFGTAAGTDDPFGSDDLPTHFADPDAGSDATAAGTGTAIRDVRTDAAVPPIPDAPTQAVPLPQTPRESSGISSTLDGMGSLSLDEGESAAGPQTDTHPTPLVSASAHPVESDDGPSPLAPATDPSSPPLEPSEPGLGPPTDPGALTAQIPLDPSGSFERTPFAASSASSGPGEVAKTPTDASYLRKVLLQGAHAPDPKTPIGSLSPRALGPEGADAESIEVLAREPLQPAEGVETPPRKLHPLKPPRPGPPPVQVSTARGPDGLRQFGMIVLLIAAVGLAGVAVSLRLIRSAPAPESVLPQEAEPTSPVPAAAEPQAVEPRARRQLVRILSIPEGAEVRDAESGEVLGRTPIDVPIAQKRQLELRVEGRRRLVMVTSAKRVWQLDLSDAP